jgi:hypothetical protein
MTTSGSKSNNLCSLVKTLPSNPEEWPDEFIEHLDSCDKCCEEVLRTKDERCETIARTVWLPDVVKRKGWMSRLIELVLYWRYQVARLFGLKGDSIASGKRLGFAFACSACVLIVGTGAARFTLERFRQLQDLRQELGLNSYVRFDHEDEDTPSIDPRRARPLAIVGKKVWLEGWGNNSVLRGLEVEMEPGLSPGEKITKKTIEIVGNDGASNEKRFSFRFTPPADGITRLVTIKLIPYDEARAADPAQLSSENTTYKVHLACRTDGPAALYEAAPLSLAKLAVNGSLLTVNVDSQLPENTPVAIAGAANSNKLIPIEVKLVQRRGEMLTFQLQVFSKRYDVRAYAMPGGKPEQLIQAIHEEETVNVVLTDLQTIEVPQTQEKSND